MNPFKSQAHSKSAEVNQQALELQATVLVECEVKRFWSYSDTFIVMGWVVNKREAQDTRVGNAVSEHVQTW